jgi:hypothetical protein
MLARRLTRRGVAVPAGAVALLVGQNATTAGVPAALVTSTVEAVGSLTAGSLLASGVSPAVTTLTDGVLKVMLVKKIITATMVVLALSAAITGGGLALGQAEGTGQPVAGKEVQQPAAEKTVEPAAKEAPAEKQKVLTPEEAVKVASDSKLTREFNENKPAVEFKVQFVTKAILVKTDAKKDAGWVHGHSPDDVCLGTLVPSAPIKAEDPLSRNHTRFVATLTAKATKQLNKAGIDDIEKHFNGKTVRVTGPVSRRDYRGYGTPPEVEIVIDDLSQLEVVK